MSSRLFTLVAATVIAWVMALNTGRDLAFNVAYLLTFVLAFSYAWAWSSLRGITLRRVTRTRRSQVGQYAEEQFEVSNRGRITKLWLEVKDESTLPWHEVSRVISNLVHNTSQRWQVRTLCTQRAFPARPALLHSGDPLGIFQVEQRIETTGYDRLSYGRRSCSFGRPFRTCRAARRTVALTRSPTWRACARARRQLEPQPLADDRTRPPADGERVRVGPDCRCVALSDLNRMSEAGLP